MPILRFFGTYVDFNHSQIYPCKMLVADCHKGSSIMRDAPGIVAISVFGKSQVLSRGSKKNDLVHATSVQRQGKDPMSMCLQNIPLATVP